MRMCRAGNGCDCAACGAPRSDQAARTARPACFMIVPSRCWRIPFSKGVMTDAAALLTTDEEARNRRMRHQPSVISRHASRAIALPHVPRPPQRRRDLGKVAEEPPRVARIDDFLRDERLRRAEGRAQAVDAILD